MVVLAGVTAMDVTTATVSVVEPDTLPNVALMVVEPAATAAASPALLTVAKAGADELHVTNDVKSWVAAFDKVPVAMNCFVVPDAMVGVVGVTAIDARVATVSVVEPDMLPEVALMVVGPAATAVASPLLLMVAKPAADELQVTDEVRSCWVLFE